MHVLSLTVDLPGHLILLKALVPQISNWKNHGIISSTSTTFPAGLTEHRMHECQVLSLPLLWLGGQNICYNPEQSQTYLSKYFLSRPRFTLQ